MKILQVDTKEIERGSTDLMTQAQKMEIITNEQYVGSADFLKSVKDMQNRVNEVFNPIIEKAHQAHKEAITQKNKFFEPLVKIERIVKGKLLSWQQTQEQKRRAEEARLAELQRKEAEKLAERARKAEEAGKAEKAEDLRQQALEKETFVPTVAPTVEKVSGITTKTIWKFEIINKDIIPRDYLTPDLEKIGQVARATKGTLTILGIKIYSEETIAAGRCL